MVKRAKGVTVAVVVLAVWALGVAASEAPTVAASGVRLRLGERPTLVDASGRSFVAKGVVYYQPAASHHYLLKGLDLARVPGDLERLKDVGFNTLLLDVAWGEFVAEADPADGYCPKRLYADRIEKLTKLARMARDAGFYLYVSAATSCVPPQVAAKDYPAGTDDAGNAQEAFQGYYIFNWLLDPAVNEGFLAYLRLLGETLAPFDNVLGYAFSFEGTDLFLPWARDEAGVRAAWRRYLRDRNPDVAFWKRRWDEADASYTSVDGIELPCHDWPFWEGYFKAHGITPLESSPVAWQDYFHWRMVATLGDGRYGLSMSAMAQGIRDGDPDALILWKPYDPLRYAWEMGCLDAFKAGKTPPDVAAIIDTIFSYPGVDLIACDAYPNATTDPAVRAEELAFTRNAARIEALERVSKRPLFCQEYGINHHEWSLDEQVVYFNNAIPAFERARLLGHNLWQGDDYYGGGIADQIQPNFGIFDVTGKPYPAVAALRALLLKR